MSGTLLTTRNYLLGYNLLCFLLWAYIGLQLFVSEYGIARTGFSPANFWLENKYVIETAQTLALLEIVHAVLGLVRSSAVTTAIQVVSRLHIIWAIWRLVPAGNATIASVTTLGAWAAAECIRYPFYGVTLLMSADDFPILKWLRYSAFLVLYPIGILSEVGCIIKAMPTLRKDTALRNYPYPMPNCLNFQADLFAVYVLILLAYVPGAVHMYTYMLRQRTKVLASKETKKDE